jgi:hypothetical protein
VENRKKADPLVAELANHAYSSFHDDLYHHPFPHLRGDRCRHAVVELLQAAPAPR